MPAAFFQDDIRDRLDALPLPAGGPSPALLACAAVLLLLLLAFAVRRLRGRAARLGTPEEHARRCLSAIVTPDCRLFHTQLAGVMVDYFEARLLLRSTRLTSAEIAGEFRRNGVMSEQWQAALAQLLAECDRAKFGPATAAWDAADALGRARRLLDELAAQAASTPALATPWKGWSNAAI